MSKKGGKKGGGSKLAAMTEEERLIAAQQKAIAEEQMAKRKEDMLTQFLKAKSEPQRKPSQSLLTIVTLCVCLLGDLTESKQQSDLALRSYLHNVDVLLDLQNSRLAFYNQDFRTKLDELKAEFNTEREQITAQHEQDSIYLQDVSFGLDQHYATLDHEAQQEFQSIRDDIKNQSMEEKNAVRVQREGEVEALWRQLQEATRSYREATEEHRIACEALREREERSSREIDTQMKRLQKIQESCSALRARMSSMQQESEAAVRDLRAIKQKVTDRRKELKTQMGSIQAQHRSALHRLTLNSDKASKQLQSIITKGERLIRLAGICRKLETEQERVQPFYRCFLSAEEQRLVQENQLEPATTELAQVMHDYAGLEGMWQRWSKVELDRLCLQQEKAALTQENLQLRTMLRQYLNGLTVSDEALQQDRTLLTVSRPSQSQRPRPSRQQQPAHVMQHTL
ncbi:hypothetical protein GJAV_G00177490 [Gymnothorax javanicus]|nr:hypothetical protein GJAV_G00177490 [Gymnothorax javanicus]